ncbi:hypothetical protein CJ030_MR6G000786 [Morella rubra]|uniref:Uncharacterized protein n=1 Tax=Morella rubra TaxID=262757 RepID=A0A6A1VCM6_9ROSI|nr:hypothetical protein CJ030_MR6G000786 [Morella rubra]
MILFCSSFSFPTIREIAFVLMFRRAIIKTQTQSSRLLRSRFWIPDATASTTTNPTENNDNKIVGNGGGVNSYRCYSHASSVGGVGLPSYMRAAVFWEPNKPLTIEELRMPRPKSGEILIKTKACVCKSNWNCSLSPCFPHLAWTNTHYYISVEPMQRMHGCMRCIAAR